MFRYDNTIIGEKAMENEISLNYTFDDLFSQEDIDNRHLFLNTQIDDNAVELIVYHILRYNLMDEGIDISNRMPIMLYINSVGGYVSDGYSIVDAISCSETPVYTVNICKCDSAAFLVYIAGHERYSFPHSEFLMHDGFVGVFDSTAKAKDRIDFETKQLEKITKEFVLQHTKITEQFYDDVYRREWYFLPNEGKEYGIVDYIVGEDCTISDIL